MNGFVCEVLSSWFSVLSVARVIPCELGAGNQRFNAPSFTLSTTHYPLFTA